MKLCMFSPREPFLDRGWPGRIDGDKVIQLAAQTLQAFFTGGGQAREHAEYPLADVVFRAPVLRPPSVRIFDADGDFVFAEQVNFETIHRHDVVAERSSTVGQLRAELAGAVAPEHTELRDWLSASS